MTNRVNGPRAEMQAVLVDEHGAPTPELELRTVQITPDQTAMIGQLNQQVEAVKQQLTIALAAILAGHGIKNADVRQLNSETHQLTVALKR